MRKPVALAVAALAALAVTAGTGLRLASADDRPRRDLVVTEKITAVTQLDLGKPGFDQGDRMTYASDILDDGGRKLGAGGGECVVTTVKEKDQGIYDCVARVKLADGQIVAQGIYDTTVTANEVAITGGTGRYAGAGGVLGYATKAPGAANDTFTDTFRFAR